MEKTTKSLYDFCMENENMKYLLDEWDYKENNKLGIDIYKISFGSEKRAWWKGKCGHEWQSMISNRTKGVNCPYCTGNKVLIGFNDLTTVYPEIAKQWHPTKNGDLKPTEVSAGSNKKVWWKCEFGHEWVTNINSRTGKKNLGCPYCSNKKILVGYNDLTTTHQELAKEWHPTKNGDLKPTEITAGNDKKVWWKCKAGHEWEASANSRTNSKTNCPICANKKVLVGYNDLGTTHPELAKEWHPTKNILKPTEVTFGSIKKVLWICSKGHEWEANINSRTSGSGCPYCSHQTSIPETIIYLTLKPFFNNVYHRYKIKGVEFDVYVKDINLLIEYDGEKWHKNKREKDKRKNKIAEENNYKFIRIWEYSNKTKKDINFSENKNILYFNIKNGYKFIPELIIKYINKNYNFNLDFSAIENIEHIAREYLKKETKENSLAALRPDIAAEWHPTKNGKLTPYNFPQKSSYKVWWQCKAGHEWKTTISSRTEMETNCPICSGRQVLEGYNDLATTHPELAKQWHPTKNGDLFPTMVTAGSSRKKIWWICDKNHEWQARIADKAKGSNCPYCTNQKVLKGYNDLLSQNSVLAKEWNYEKNKIKPDEITSCSGKKVWWVCNKGHEWESKISNRKNGSGCPICLGRKILEGYNDFPTTCPDLLQYWDFEKNVVSPTTVSKGSNKKYYWMKEGQSYFASPNDARKKYKIP